MNRVSRFFLKTLFVFSAIPVSLIFYNIYQNYNNLLVLRKNEVEFRSKDILNSVQLRETVDKMKEGYGVILLNRFAIRMTLNWLCNTKRFKGVHNNILFIVMDKHTENELRKFYPKLKIVIWLAPALQTTFRPYDTTYMSFFLMRTNMIQALQKLGKGFWMLQADTIWRDNFFNHINVKDYDDADILLDQQGYSQTAEIRQKTMNGANFFVPSKETSQELVESWLTWQKSVYITDPDLIKIFCLRGDFKCGFVPYRLVTGWEWVYGDQSDPPVMIQMDGETGGNKEEVLKNYKFWFLEENNKCNVRKVNEAIEMISNHQVPRVISSSKSREQFYLKLGELMNQIPIFGHYSSVYGGLTSLYLQIF